MLRPDPSTPRRTQALGPNARSLPSRNGTPSNRRSHTNSAPQSPFTPRTQVSSLSSSTLSELPPLLSIAGAIPNWLPEHTPLVTTTDNESAVAALIASRAAVAARHQDHRRDMGISAIDWDWYIKEITRCKLMYSQVTDIITGLCAFLELTTDAMVFLYCARPERSPQDPTVGRGEVVYASLSEWQDTEGSALSNDLIDSAQALGDHRSKSWLSRQRSYDALARHSSTQAMRNGDAAHRYGDFPRLARFDADSANSVVLAMYDLNLPAIGVTSTRYSASTARNENFSHPSHPLPNDSRDDGDDEDNSPSPPTDSFVGRRARESELRYMDRLHLTELQKAQVRLALWETHPEHWYDALSPFFGSQEQVLFSLYRAFFGRM